MIQRLIDANALPKMILGTEDGERWDIVLQKDIDKAPTIDPVKHGHWIDDSMYHYKECSVCHRISDWLDFPYCPWCGAKMDKVMK